MPFKSEAQRRYLFSQEPEVAEEFAAHTTEKQMKRLPEHVQKLESGGHVCMHCGGEVDDEGYAMGGGAVDEESEDLLDNNNDESKETAQHASTVRMRRASFADAMRARRED